MAKSTDDLRKVALLVVLLLGLVAVVVYRLRPALVESVVIGQGKLPQPRTYRVPSLGWSGGEAREAEVPPTRRSLFTFGPPPTPTPDPRPTPTPFPTEPPEPVVIPTPPGIDLADGTRLPLPPRFPLSYVGWLGPSRLPVAVFLDGAEIVVVPEGEKVRGTFIVRDVDPTGVTIGFAGYPETVTRKVSISQ